MVVLGSLAASAAPAQPVDSSIERVTIYPNQLARVERVAELRPGSASGILAFEDLPASIVDDSVRLAVESGTGELGAVETARAPVGEPPRERERTLRKRLRKLRHQREAARLDTEAGEMQLERKARVAQATGEGWRDVELHLATIRPVQGERPEPGPWWIELAPERDVSGDAAALEGGTETMARASEPTQGKAQSAQTVNAAFATTYVVSGRVTVPAGNEPKTVQLGTETLAAEVGVEIFPQQQQRAWLIGRTQWSGAGPLPAGPLSRYRDGASVGRGRLAGWAPGEERRLSFGTDPRVEVRFEPLVDQAGERGWITSESTRARRYRLKITNHHQRSLAVTALFRIPVPRNEAITVERHFSEPPSSENVDDKQGAHAWRTQLGAGSSIVWTLGYTVSYPEGRRLRGL